MASALASQLAQIRAKSTNPLDLKAQRKAHSKSLLFEPGIAANQDFDSLYQLCYEGFLDLCRLDARFTKFSANIFSEQSKQEDRTMMTESQNQSLDSVLENFLGLVSGRLLLKPAMQAVEWTVRRFRVHEYNINSFIMTFLPYHTRPMFATVLSILPSNIPHTLKFLYPYVQSLSCPPRHAIVYAASHNQSFFAAFNSFVLQISRLGFHYPSLLSFWASTTTEAIALMLDKARLGRQEAQIKNQEDVIMRIMPILNDGLSIEGIPDLRVGCYMILTILSSKAFLNDEALNAMMEVVVGGWEQSSHAGLICLTVMIQKVTTSRLPIPVLKALLGLTSLEDDLFVLKQRYSVDKLALGIILGLLDNLRKTTKQGSKRKAIENSKEASHERIFLLLTQDLMDPSSITRALEAILNISTAEASRTPMLSSLLVDTVVRATTSDRIGSIVQSVTRDFSSTHEDVPQRLQVLGQSRSSSPTGDQIDELPNCQPNLEREPLDDLLSRLKSRHESVRSFLALSDHDLFTELSEAFKLASASPTDLDRILDLPVLRKTQAMTEPTFLSFFIRLWCGHYSPGVRATALDVVSEYLVTQQLSSDVQFLLPYTIFALMDPSRKVRQASVGLVRLLAVRYRESKDSNITSPRKVILGQNSIYGSTIQDQQPIWLSFAEVRNFLNDFLISNLEESLIDADHIGQSLIMSLKGVSKSPQSSSAKDLKTPLRQAIFSFLCNQITHTPLKGVQLRLLPQLNQIKRVGSLTRGKVLMPLFTQYVKEQETQFREACSKERVEPEYLMKAVVEVLPPSDRDGITALRNAIRPHRRSEASLLNAAAFRRIRDTWSSIDYDQQAAIANDLLELSMADAESASDKAEQSEAAEILQAVELSTETLKDFLENLPIPQLEDTPSMTKRRKIDHEPQPRINNPQALSSALRHVTFVLELITTRKPERHPELLDGLFQLLTGLKNYRILSGSELGYLEVMTLTSASAIISNTIASASQIDRSAVRADILIECVRATENPQVQQAALLLASDIASNAPELLIHNIMPLFTFAGKGIMRKSDEYSSHIIEKTMTTVIPPLVESLRRRKADPIVSISELLLSFVAAYKDIPLQRRKSIFMSLSNTVGAEEFLFALLILLVDKYPGDQNVITFVGKLTAEHSCRVQLMTIEKYIDVLLDSRNSKPSVSLHLLNSDKTQESQDPIANLLPLPISILKAEDLKKTMRQLLGQKGDDAQNLRSHYARILEQVFILSEIVKDEESQRMLCGEALDALLRLLSLDKFIEALPELLQRTNDDLRVNILLSLERRLREHTSTDSSSQIACLSFLPHLRSSIEDLSSVPLRLAVINCIDPIIEKFGKRDTSAVIDTAMTILGPNCLEATDANIRSSSLVCLATIVEVLREAFIPLLPRILPKAMDHLAHSVEEDIENPKLHNSVYTLINGLLLYLPWMVRDAYLDRLLKVSYESSNAEMGDDCNQPRLDTLRLAAKSIDPKECLLAQERTWTVAMAEGPLAVREYLVVLQLVIERQSKSAIAKQLELLAKLFLRTFDLRRIQCSPRTEDSYEDSEIEEVENAVNDALIAMIYKLNDTVFRPIFIRLSEWANSPALKLDKGSTLFRRTTWWTFLLRFFGTLKSLVTNYAGLVLDDAIDILASSTLQDADSQLLWQRVVLTLHSAFENDQDDFFQTPSHFSPVCEGLVSQLRRCANESLRSELISTITQLAATTSSPTQHKSLCGPLLQMMRDDSAAVKFAAVKCQLSLTEKLGEEWLAQLPEMLPFISEGMEEDDEPVEMEVRRWVKRIEEILGESIGPMLQ